MGLTIKKQNLFSLMLGAVGVVYGDIGTSPLYALRSCFALGHLPVTDINIFGLICLFIWTLFIVVTVKYVNLVMNVDNNGEGGILALSSLCSKLKLHKFTNLPFLLGLLGMALFMGDGVITPAISVISSLEGLQLVAPWLAKHVVGLSVLVLTLLFMVQKNGSGKIGKYFGPVMLLWFAILAVIGIYNIVLSPSIIQALNPYYAIHFLRYNGLISFLVIGGVFLVVTGGEALYADLGHFGKRPIQLLWNFFILPALILTYLGQGALLLRNPEALTNPFYLAVPPLFLYPLLLLSAFATIIASQAIISGIFSMSWQAIMLNYLPRMRVLHTSSVQIGQVYVPVINYLFYILTVISVVYFGSSERLASAYGLSVAGIMAITTSLLLLLAYNSWHWSLARIFIVFLPLGTLDLIFIVTNLAKLFEGAWYAILVTSIACYIMRVWLRGNRALVDQKTVLHTTVSSFLQKHAKIYPQRIPGTAIFLSRYPDQVPNSLTINLSHNKFLHEKILFLSIITKSSPYVSKTQSKFLYTKIEEQNAYQIIANFGFKEIPDLHKVLGWAQELGIIKDKNAVSCFVSKGVPIIMKDRYIMGFSDRLYVFLTRNSLNATEFYKIPNNQVVELGVRYNI